MKRSPIQRKTPLRAKTGFKSKPRKALNRKSKTPKAKAKENAWKYFSIYIRSRDCLRFTGGVENGYCVTCSPLDPTQGQLRPFKGLQAGHFITGRGNSVLFDERVVYTQCPGCNLNPPHGKGGNHGEYFRFMLTQHTMEDIDLFRSLKKETIPYKLHDFEAIAEKYILKTAQLLKDEGII